MVRSGFCNFNVQTGKRLVRYESPAIPFHGEFEIPRPLQIIVRPGIDKTHHMGCASGKRSFAKHDAAMDDHFVEQDHIAQLEIIFDLMVFEYLAHMAGEFRIPVRRAKYSLTFVLVPDRSLASSAETIAGSSWLKTYSADTMFRGTKAIPPRCPFVSIGCNGAHSVQPNSSAI